jgi:hypothetical protein
MTASFEREKNLKAGMYTGMVCLALLIVFFFAKWTLPVIPQPVVEEGIEVNLGNSDEGLGDVAPQVPGDPAPAAEETYTPPQTSQAVANNEPDIATDDNDVDAPEISKPIKKVVKATPKPIERTEVVNKPRANTTPVTNPTPTPAPPAPKAVYKGGTGTGGNRADSYNESRNQGIAGGRGDQGNPNGNPNSDSYKGNASSGRSGVRITRGLGGRNIVRIPSFEDDFNENAKVAVDIRVDKSGRVVSAVVNPRGTTTTNSGIRSIATRKALQLKLNAGDEDEQTGTIVFDFKLRG